MSQGAPTLASIGRSLGVSRQTVSNALNAPHRLSPETLDRVLHAIDEQGYRPHRQARSLRRQRSSLIGYCVRQPTERSNPVLDRFVHAISASAERRGHHVLLFTHDPDAPATFAYGDLVAQRAVDGFVLSDTGVGDVRQQWLRARNIPFAAFGRRWEEPEIGAWVDVDGAAGTAQAVGHLAGGGHRRLAFVGWPPGSGVGDDRLAGFSRACSELALAADVVAKGDLVEGGRAAASDLLDQRDPPTGFVCASDDLAIGVLYAVRERGLAVGREVGIVGFDDSPAASLPGIELSSIRQPIDQAGELVIELVTLQLEGTAAPAGTESGGEPTRLLSPELVVRASSTRT